MTEPNATRDGSPSTGGASLRGVMVRTVLAATTIAALGMLVLCGMALRSFAYERSIVRAYETMAALAPGFAQAASPAALREAADRAVATEPGRLAVRLPDGTVAGGSSWAPGAGAPSGPRAADVPAPDGAGRVVVQAVWTRHGWMWLELYVPPPRFPYGLPGWWALTTGSAVLLVLLALLAADRIGVRTVRIAERMEEDAHRVSEGEWAVRLRAEGPLEFRGIAASVNLLADRIAQLLATGRQNAADLSHSLRTPMTVLRLNVDRLGEGIESEPVRKALARLEQDVDRIIELNRTDDGGELSAWCDAAEVTRERVEFWSVLARDQGRSWNIDVPGGPAHVHVARADLAAALDALLGNIFQHTPEGTGYSVIVQVGTGWVAILVSDSGPGISEPEQMTERGRSGHGSTGLGLDIARRVAESTTGELRVERSVLGGAHVGMWLRTAEIEATPRRGNRRRKRRH